MEEASKVLLGRSAVITGASRGLGREIAKEFVKAGAHVIMCGRDQTALDQSYEEVTALATEDQLVACRLADVSNPAEVASLIQDAHDMVRRIDVLVNNAGVYGPKGASEEVDWEEWIHAVEINLYGSVLMCRAVVPQFKLNCYGKIIQLSGGGATNPLPRFSAYAASKAAIVRFAETLAEELREYTVDVNVIAPGALNTRMLDEVLSAGPEIVGQSFYEKSLRQKEVGGAPLWKAANLAVFLASSRSDGITGKLLSAVWDPWETLPDHLEELNKSDIYTLRRIVPGDRGMAWGNK